MESFGFAPKLLINESERSEIQRMIRAARNPRSKIVGSLFGLWRNSLITPVVQLITGPGQHGTVSEKAFRPDFDYHEAIKRYLGEQHGLLQIGLWCSGDSSRYPRLDRRSPGFDFRNTIMPNAGRYVVLMFAYEDSRGRLFIRYEIIDREKPEYSRASVLKEEDVLPGASSFRLLQEIRNRVNQGAKFPWHLSQPTGSFSTSMPDEKYRQPSAQVIPTNKPTSMVKSQWYESDVGSNLLRRLINGFKSKGVPTDMSRSSNSHDLTLEVNRSVRLHFPADFPKGQMSVTWVIDSESRFTNNHDMMSYIILRRILEIISVEEAISLDMNFSKTTMI